MNLASLQKALKKRSETGTNEDPVLTVYVIGAGGVDEKKMVTSRVYIDSACKVIRPGTFLIRSECLLEVRKQALQDKVYKAIECEPKISKAQNELGRREERLARVSTRPGLTEEKQAAMLVSIQNAKDQLDSEFAPYELQLLPPFRALALDEIKRFTAHLHDVYGQKVRVASLCDAYRGVFPEKDSSFCSHFTTTVEEYNEGPFAEGGAQGYSENLSKELQNIRDILKTMAKGTSSDVNDKGRSEDDDSLRTRKVSILTQNLRQGDVVVEFKGRKCTVQRTYT
jgi:hypothetical protein